MVRFAGFERIDIDGVPVLWRRDPRFKTFKLTFAARRQLDGRAAARALLPELLLQGTVRDPSRLALVRRMEALYGGLAVPSVAKVGETHVLQATVDSVAGAFLPGRPDQLGAGLALLADVLNRPRLCEGGFPDDVFLRERRNQANAVRAEFDDKGSYARRQAVTLCCEGEPMGIQEHGGLGAILALDRFAPERARLDFLRHGDPLLLAMGALDDGVVDAAATWLEHLPERQPQTLPRTVEVGPRPHRTTLERADVGQGKLVMVLRFPPAPASAWPARRLFTSLLGGGPHARLFKEVRERRSLAYSVAAGADRHKGLLLVAAGVDEAAAATVEDVVLREVEVLRQGRFSAEELQTAKAGIVSGLAAVDDSISARLAFTFERWLEGTDREPHEQAEVYLGLDAAAAAHGGDGLWLDHVYLLAPAEAA